MVEKKEKTTTRKSSTTRTRKTTSTKTTSKKTSSSKRYIYAVGRRKTASARVRLYLNGKGKITVNGKDYTEYFPTESMQKDLMAPLQRVGMEKDFDITVKVVGGGLNGQAGAVRHGIARALEKYDLELRPVLKAEGFLTRDPRMKERKKPGLKRARRAPQWSKR